MLLRKYIKVSECVDSRGFQMAKRTAVSGSSSGQSQNALTGRKVGKKKELLVQPEADAVRSELTSDAHSVDGSKVASASTGLGDGGVFSAMVASAAASGEASAPAASGGAASAPASGGGLSTGLLVAGGLGVIGGVAVVAGGGGKSSKAPPPNQVPVFAAAEVAVAVDEDKPLSNSVKATDGNNDALTYAVGTQPANGSVAVNADGTYVYTPKANYSGADSFTITASDGKGGSATQAVKVTVNAINDAPAFAAAEATPAAFNEDNALAGTVRATDIESDALTYAVGTRPANGSVTVNTDGSYVYTPKANYNGVDSFTVTASDGKGGTATQTVKLTINAVNDLPVVSASADRSVSFQEAAPTALVASSQVIKVAGTDADGGVVTFTVPASTAVANITLAPDGSGFTYTPKDINYHGTETITVRLNDAQGAGNFTEYSVSVTVAPNTAENQGIDNGLSRVTYDAAGSGYTAGDNFTFVDDSTKTTNVEIANFQLGDKIQVSASASKYSFAVTGSGDLEITYLDTASGSSNVILLKGVAANAGFIQDEATAEAQLGLGNFFLSLADGATNAYGTAIVGTSLDTDNDSNVNTFALFNAAGGNIAYVDDANLANRALIQGFGAGDTITVSNAAASAYSFARDTNAGNDIVITYNNSGKINEIVLQGAATGSSGTLDTLSAVEALLGAGFFKSTSGGSGGSNAPFTPTATTVADNASGRSTFDASNASIKFTDDAAIRSDVILQNFGADDRIFTNTTASNYNFAISDTDADDLVITFNNNGVLNQFVLDEILVGKDLFIDNYASAVKAVGFDFMNFG
jgi:VCBS repeat-containing protein